MAAGASRSNWARWHHRTIVVLAILGGASVMHAALPRAHAGAPVVRRAQPSPGTPNSPPSARGTQNEAKQTGIAGTNAPTRSQRVRLRLGRWALDSYAFLWFMAVLALEFAIHRAGEDVKARLRSWQFAVGVLGLGGVFWAFREVGFRTRLVALDYQLAVGSTLAIFATVATSTHMTAAGIGRFLFRDVRAIVNRWSTWLAAVLVAAFVVAQPELRPTSGVPTGIEFDRWLVSQPREALLSAEKAVLIVKVNDYQCGPCRRMETEYSPVIRRFLLAQPQYITYRVIDFPADPDCNSYAPLGQHDAACEAAAVVRVAATQGRRAEMEAWLWANQDKLSPSNVLETGRTISGLRDFDTALASALADVRSDIEVAHTLRVVGTPTYFVNGVRLPPGVPASDLERAIRSELANIQR